MTKEVEFLDMSPTGFLNIYILQVSLFSLLLNTCNRPAQNLRGKKCQTPTVEIGSKLDCTAILSPLAASHHLTRALKLAILRLFQLKMANLGALITW